MTHYIIAFDLGTMMVKCVALVFNDSSPDQLVLLYCEEQRSHGIRRGVVCDANEAQKVIKNLLFGAEKKVEEHKKRNKITDFSKTTCAGVGGHSFSTSIVKDSIEVKGGIVNANTLETLAANVSSRVEAECSDTEFLLEQVPICYSIDNTPDEIDVLGKQGNHISGSYLCYKMGKKYKDSIIAAFPVNNKPDMFCSIAFAKAKVLLRAEQLSDGVVLVDIGCGTMSVAAFFRDKIRYEVSIPFGSSSITGDIAKGLVLDAEEAEHMKCVIGLLPDNILEENVEVSLPSGRVISFTGKKLNYIIKARAEELAAYISSAVTEARRRGCRNPKVYLTGGGAKLKDIDVLVHNATECRVSFLAEHYNKIMEDRELRIFAAPLGMIQEVVRRKMIEKAKDNSLPIDDVNVEDVKTDDDEKDAADGKQVDKTIDDIKGKKKGLFSKFKENVGLLFDDTVGR